MPRLEDDPPDNVLIERDGLSFTVGKRADLKWSDVVNLDRQRQRSNWFLGTSLETIPRDMLEALVLTMRVFVGSSIVDFEREINDAWKKIDAQEAKGRSLYNRQQTQGR